MALATLPELQLDLGSTTPAYIEASEFRQRRVLNTSGGTIYYATAQTVDSGGTSILAGAEATFSNSQWIISASRSKVLVFDAAPDFSFDDVSVDALTVGSTLSVGTTSTLTGAATTTGGVAGGKPYRVGTMQLLAAAATDTACSNGTAYVGSIFLPMNATITGIQYLVGSVGGTTKVIASLHSASGAPLANSNTAGVTVGTQSTIQAVPFTGTYAAKGPAYLFLALTFDGTTAKFYTVPTLQNAGNGIIGDGVTQTFGTVAAFTPPTAFAAGKIPVAALY